MFMRRGTTEYYVVKDLFKKDTFTPGKNHYNIINANVCTNVSIKSASNQMN